MSYIKLTFDKNEKKKDVRSEDVSKFNVTKDISQRTYDGIVFDSILEMRYYRDEVCPKMESGDIVSCELQRPYELQPKFVHDGKKVNAIIYVADFVLTYADGHEVVIDTKGMPDSAAVIKRKLFWYTFPEIDYRWISYSKIDGGWCEYDYIKKQRSLRKLAKKKKAQEVKEENENGKG